MMNLFTTHRIEVKAKKIELFPIGDVHFDTSGCDHERFKKHIANTKKFNQNECLYLFMGDTHDFASASEKKKMLSAGLHETTLDRFDRMAMSDINKFTKICEHMKGHMIGVIGGNHTWKFCNGQLSDEIIAEEMKTKYLGWLSYIRISMGMGQGKRTSYDIVACHGKAGGKLLGTSINQVDDLRKIFPNADLFIMGHDHKLSSTPAVILYADINDRTGELVIKQKEQRLVRSGSFKKTYTVNEESYEISRLYQPAILGAARITLEPFESDRMVDGKRSCKLIKTIECHV